MISIIIPVYNEAHTIIPLLTHLNKVGSEKNISEIIVVDGGSTDNTAKVVTQSINSWPIDVKLLSSQKGRARQMNTAARDSQGQILYFLHADSYPPKNFDELILTALAKGYKAGCFRMKFDSKHPLLRFFQFFTRFNLRICRGGDQSLFVERKLYSELNGFNEAYTIYEDCEFINRIYAKTRFKIIPKNIITSARKYQEVGTWKLQYHFAIIHLKKRLGATPEELNSYYSSRIKA